MPLGGGGPLGGKGGLPKGGLPGGPGGPGGGGLQPDNRTISRYYQPSSKMKNGITLENYTLNKCITVRSLSILSLAVWL